MSNSAGLGGIEAMIFAGLVKKSQDNKKKAKKTKNEEMSGVKKKGEYDDIEEGEGEGSKDDEEKELDRKEKEMKRLRKEKKALNLIVALKKKAMKDVKRNDGKTADNDTSPETAKFAKSGNDGLPKVVKEAKHGKSENGGPPQIEATMKNDKSPVTTQENLSNTKEKKKIKKKVVKKDGVTCKLNTPITASADNIPTKKKDPEGATKLKPKKARETKVLKVVKPIDDKRRN
uniref:Uncharacterized protein n=1 Tax=Rhabditophanes sp. KR3021 TaxID=114890 RepID=A0AC35TWY4_9BILA